jgi:hypothetical protein
VEGLEAAAKRDAQIKIGFTPDKDQSQRDSKLSSQVSPTARTAVMDKRIEQWKQ